MKTPFLVSPFSKDSFSNAGFTSSASGSTSADGAGAKRTDSISARSGTGKIALYNSKAAFLVCSLIQIFLTACSQNTDYPKQVVEKGEVGKQFEYEIKGDPDRTRYRMTYIGSIKTKSDTTLKFLNLINITGGFDSRKAHYTGAVLLYDQHNNYLGDYAVQDTLSLPVRVEGTTLVFSGQQDCNAITKIDFSNEIPKEIFIKCVGDSGDFYPFDHVDFSPDQQ
ncbi:hypothetical protein [Chitinophaga pinensis]|uniref:Uncharacterized protein n=1 Tax=Chitinophaga pinensis (strain ATCC 43595 / DSM 2588 / LMG 13176 / NBRC 15968 / NCIMB 11800 / UQM 2034) TaxID=485918 RepID=A0A979G452_CHIPD|nr:hypothetical protein [Chitinophaga pinensis]ACU60505.1 hypothetical protein Cpin_3030 [Chitinophaga pinensis DSM 2588]